MLAFSQTDLEKECGHSQFCAGLRREVQSSGLNSIMALPPCVPKGVVSEVSIGGFMSYAGCDWAFDAAALDVFSLACLHVYHIMCFAHICLKHGKCVVFDCSEFLPERVLNMLGLCPRTRTSKKEISCENKAQVLTTLRRDRSCPYDVEEVKSWQRSCNCRRHWRRSRKILLKQWPLHR